MFEKDYRPERRPLAVRKLAVLAAITRMLAGLGVSPNAISITSFLVSFGTGWALFASNGNSQQELLLVASCLLLLMRGACNIFDGMVAIHTGKASRAGELYNEVPDRLSDSVILIGAGYASGGTPELGYLAAIAALFTAYVRVQACSLGVPADFRGPMAKVQRMVLIASAALWTALLPESWQVSKWFYSKVGTFDLALVLIIAGCVLTSARRLRRSAHILSQDRAS